MIASVVKPITQDIWGFFFKLSGMGYPASYNYLCSFKHKALIGCSIFCLAAPISTIDFNIKSGKDIPIEIRSEDEIKFSGKTPLNHSLSPALNHGFDVTPAKYVTGLITEKGISEASSQGLKKLFRK